MSANSKKHANRVKAAKFTQEEKTAKLAQMMQAVFEPKILEIAWETEFIKRQRKVNALQWIQAAVATFHQDPKASLEQISEKLKSLFNIDISEQAVSKQFQKPQTPTFLKELISEVMSMSFQFSDTNLKIATQFNGIYAGDCTTIKLPNALHHVFPGSGNQFNDKMASMKIFFRFELFSGQYDETIINSGRTSDCTFYRQAKPTPKGALELYDMGFFALDRFEKCNKAGVFWISRVPAGKYLTIDGKEQKFSEYLQGCKDNRVDKAIQLGKAQFSCRLVAIRAPKKVVKQRKKRWKEENKGKNPSKDQLVMMQWSVYVTNISREMVSYQGIYDLYSLRWQVELVFKSWKSDLGLDKSNGRTGNRILCEIYIKFLSILITNWFATVEGGPLNGISPKKILRKVRENFPELFLALASGNVDYLNKVILRIVQQINKIRPQKRRKKHPTARQTLENIRVNA